MAALTHEAILKAGRYRSLAVEDDEAVTAKALHRFMLRLRLCEEALAREYHPADEMRCPVHFCVGQEAVPAALSLQWFCWSSGRLSVSSPSLWRVPSRVV